VHTGHRKRAQRARSIGLYFARIYITLAIWQLGAVLCVLDTYSAAPLIVGITWSTFVPALTAATALTKPDVREAVLDLLLCRWASRKRRQGFVATHAAQGEQEGEPAELKQTSYSAKTCECTEDSSTHGCERHPDETRMHSARSRRPGQSPTVEVRPRNGREESASDNASAEEVRCLTPAAERCSARPHPTRYSRTDVFELCRPHVPFSLVVHMRRLAI
jgi:hypothetical protein